MARKRMFSVEVVEADSFLDLPLSAQCLYFHCGMAADDDGFVSSPKRIIRTIGCEQDDLQVLVEAGFLIPFKSGVVAIRDWRLNNYIQKDRYHPTVYTDEFEYLLVEKSGRYVFNEDL